MYQKKTPPTQIKSIWRPRKHDEHTRFGWKDSVAYLHWWSGAFHKVLRKFGERRRNNHMWLTFQNMRANRLPEKHVKLMLKWKLLGKRLPAYWRDFCPRIHQEGTNKKVRRKKYVCLAELWLHKVRTHAERHALGNLSFWRNNSAKNPYFHVFFSF